MFRITICTLALLVTAACGTAVPGPDGPIQLSAAERFSLPDENSPASYSIPDQLLATGNTFWIRVYGEDLVNGYNPCRLGYTHRSELYTQVIEYADGSPDTIKVFARDTICVRNDLL